MLVPRGRSADAMDVTSANFAEAMERLEAVLPRELYEVCGVQHAKVTRCRQQPESARGHVARARVMARAHVARADAAGAHVARARDHEGTGGEGTRGQGA